MAPEAADAKPAHGVVLLAAGESSRLQQPKQLLLHHGETLVRRMARMALQTSPADAVIVVGAYADCVFPYVEDLPFRRVDCADWRAGMGASLRAGVTALSTNCLGVLVVVCDQPRLDAAHLQALRASWQARIEFAAASFYRGRAGVPALLPVAWFADVDASIGNRGARDLLAARRDQLTLIKNEVLSIDIDHPADLTYLAP